MQNKSSFEIFHIYTTEKKNCFDILTDFLETILLLMCHWSKKRLEASEPLYYLSKVFSFIFGSCIFFIMRNHEVL